MNVSKDIKINSLDFSNEGNGSKVKINVNYKGENITLEGSGKGKFEAVTKAIKNYFNSFNFENLTYDEHAIGTGAGSHAITYLSFENDGKKVWGVGIDRDIMTSSIYALFSAINRM